MVKWFKQLCSSNKAHPIESPPPPPPIPIKIFPDEVNTTLPHTISYTTSILPSNLILSSSPSISKSNDLNKTLVSDDSRLLDEPKDQDYKRRRLASISLSTHNNNEDNLGEPTHSIDLIPPTPIDSPINTYSTTSTSSTSTTIGLKPFNSTFSDVNEEEINSLPLSTDPPSSTTHTTTVTTTSCLPSAPPLPHPFSCTSSQSPPSPQYRRTSDATKFKETLNAFEMNEGESESGLRTVNQYILKGVIGRGSYASVERATDRETGIDYAVKEFSKAKLRKRAASEMIRGNLKVRGGIRGRSPRVAQVEEPVQVDLDELGPDNLSLIRSEVAIMKKVSHPNICVIHEVIDVTAADSLLVVMELCEGGPITHVSLEKESAAYDEEKCRDIFIQLLLGLAYLHHNSIIHRDIKPDNCLFMSDLKTVKIVDFGVSEMFVKSATDDLVQKSVGSPAFMSPELCDPKHGHLHGFACDIWSLGATLFTLACGRVPFAKDNVLDLIVSISEDPLVIPSNLSPDLQNLFSRILQKDPHSRITMLELWVHPWVTKNGSEPMMDYELNCSDPILEPTIAEVDSALRSFRSSILVAKIAGKFRRGMHRRSLSANSNILVTSDSTLPSSSPQHSPSLQQLSTSPISSPLLSATVFSSVTSNEPENGTGNPITKDNINLKSKPQLVPIRKETVSSISTFDSLEGGVTSSNGGGGSKGDRIENRSESPSSSIGMVNENKMLFVAEPEEESILV